MTKARYQLFIIEDDNGKLLAKHLGPCKSEAQATVMFNNAYANQTVNKPVQVLLVPGSNIFLCKPIQMFQLEAIVAEEPGIESEPPKSEPPSTAQA